MVMNLPHLRLKTKFRYKSRNKSRFPHRAKRRQAELSEAESGWETDQSERTSSMGRSLKDKMEEVKSGAHVRMKSTLEDDSFASLDADPFEDIRGETCTLHTYDVRLDSRGEAIVLRTGTKSDIRWEKDNSPEAALVLFRIWDGLSHTNSRLEIRSPHIRAALQKIAPSYPGIQYSNTCAILFHQPEYLFHYRHELYDYAMASTNPQVKEHIIFCLKYMSRALQNEIRAYDNMVKHNTSAPGLEFDNLWMVFKPGAPLYRNTNGVEHVLRLRSMAKVKRVDSWAWELEAEQIQCNGYGFGCTKVQEKISPYKGHKPFSELAIFPLEFHADEERVRQRLIDRGRKYVSLFGIHYRMYDGYANLLPDRKGVQVRHRIVLDCKEFYDNHQRGDDTKVVFIAESIIKPDSDNCFNLNDDQLLMCHHQMPGFSLGDKQWGHFDVISVSEIDFNADAFDKLVLPRGTKSLISSLVKSPEASQAVFDDLIKGKGKGLIFLLYGPPGVGKTFTAESVADYTKRPLYFVSCGDIGHDVSEAEYNLTTALSLAGRWNAIALIDEADVFMQERTLADLTRNELVSVMLRCMEYFEGTLFLTTNRVEVIDSAFKSRIHCLISYPVLSAGARRQLWKTFIAQGSKSGPYQWLDDPFLDKVAEAEINGRQIKNAVRVAHGLAIAQERELLPEDVLLVLDNQQTFDAAFHRLGRTNFASTVPALICGLKNYRIVVIGISLAWMLSMSASFAAVTYGYGAAPNLNTVFRRFLSP